MALGHACPVGIDSLQRTTDYRPPSYGACYLDPLTLDREAVKRSAENSPYEEAVMSRCDIAEARSTSVESFPASVNYGACSVRVKG